MAKKEEKKEEKRQVTAWRPLSELVRWEREMERNFDDFFSRRLRPSWDEWWWPSAAIGIPAPTLDLYEDRGELVAKVELPGLGKDDVQVKITDHRLVIKGEKKKEEEVKEKDYYRSERSYGAFTRSVELPEEVQVDKARASFKNGVLEIRVPKSEEAKKKEIRVEVE